MIRPHGTEARFAVYLAMPSAFGFTDWVAGADAVGREPCISWVRCSPSADSHFATGVAKAGLEVGTRHG